MKYAVLVLTIVSSFMTIRAEDAPIEMMERLCNRLHDEEQRDACRVLVREKTFPRSGLLACRLRARQENFNACLETIAGGTFDEDMVDMCILRHKHFGNVTACLSTINNATFQPEAVSFCRYRLKDRSNLSTCISAIKDRTYSDLKACRRYSSDTYKIRCLSSVTQN